MNRNNSKAGKASVTALKKLSFGEAIALRGQQVEVAKEYEAIQHRRLQAGVGTTEDAWDASFDRWDYELKLVQEKQALQDM